MTSYIYTRVGACVDGGMGLGIGYKREKIKMCNTIYFDTMSGTEVVL